MSYKHFPAYFHCASTAQASLVSLKNVIDCFVSRYGDIIIHEPIDSYLVLKSWALRTPVLSMSASVFLVLFSLPSNSVSCPSVSLLCCSLREVSCKMFLLLSMMERKCLKCYAQMCCRSLSALASWMLMCGSAEPPSAEFRLILWNKQFLWSLICSLYQS